MKHQLSLAILISGGGTNLQEIIDRIGDGTLDAQIAVVISNKADAFGLEQAKRAGIRAVFINPRNYAGRHEYNQAIAEELLRSGAELVVMAGYMRLLGKEVLDAFPNKVINLHPALLPSFAGEHGIGDAFAYGVKVTGVTVHFADGEYDTGPIIAQEPIIVHEDDTEESLEERIHDAEHELLPRVIQLISEGRVRIEGRRVRIDPK
jgi:phosphoribosylglycinamide formyltransferase-1